VSRGGERFAAGDFVGAREAYRAAYALHPDPALLFNIASTYRREGNVPQAITHYQKFLAQVPADDARAPLARRLIAELAAAPRARSAARPTAPDPPEVRRAAAAGRGWRRAATRGSAFGALLLLAAGTHQALRAEAAEDQIRTLVRDGRGWDEQLDEIDQRGRAAGGRAAAFFVAGSTLAVTSLVLFFTGDREPRTNPSSLALELRGTTLSVRGAF
jgi:tetratricopeptide (TPR) repeat protein